jgi:holliday junction DNA helicase RuvA
MIGKLIGKIDEIYEDKLILNVGGVGYNIFSSTKTLANLTKNDNLSLIIETIVREDHIHLYGFRNEVERSWFNELCKVKGVGNKVALKILSVLEINDIILAISSADKSYFATVSGIGPKLALRIVSELKDAVAKMGGNIVADNIKIQSSSNDNQINNTQLLNDAVSALENLGYKRMEVYRVVSQNISENPDSSLETLITNSLRKISK